MVLVILNPFQFCNPVKNKFKIPIFQAENERFDEEEPVRIHSLILF